MIEQNIVRTVALSKRYPGIQVSMRIRIDFVAPKYSVEVTRPPSVEIPLHLIEPVWSDGICSGVSQAVEEAHEILAVTGIRVEIRRLESSEPFLDLDDSEAYQLGRELKSLTREMLYPIFSQGLGSTN